MAIFLADSRVIRYAKQATSNMTFARPTTALCIIVSALLFVVYLPRLLSWTSAGDSSEPGDPHVDEDTYIIEARCPHYTPLYPSAGGPGCRPKCIAREGTTNSSYAAGFYNRTHSWPKDLVDNMIHAAAILKKYGTLHHLNTERSIYLHITFDYYCCYTPEEAAEIGGFINAYAWTPLEVRFHQLECGIYGAGDMVAFMLMLDEKSQKDLLQRALESEKELEIQTGVHKRIPHTDLHGFHMTLATVNQSVFPVQPAVKEINKLIPPGKWHSSPIVLHKPLCNRQLCERTSASQKSGTD